MPDRINRDCVAHVHALHTVLRQPISMTLCCLKLAGLCPAGRRTVKLQLTRGRYFTVYHNTSENPKSQYHVIYKLSSVKHTLGANPPWLQAGEIETRSFAWGEGNVQQPARPYAIPYWVLTPKRTELSNLLVVATPSGSHIGFSSLQAPGELLEEGFRTCTGPLPAQYA